MGKTTFIEDVIKAIPGLTVPSYTYRDVVKEKGIEKKINRKTCKESQRIVFDAIDQCTKSAPDNSVIDRSVMDAVAYTTWPTRHNKGKSDITPQFAAAQRRKAVKLMDELDLIVYIPATDDIPIEEDNLRDTNLEYRDQMAKIFEELLILDIDDPLFDKYGYKVVVISGTREERVADFKQFTQALAK